MFQVLMGGMQGVVRLLVGAWWRQHEITNRASCGLTRRKRVSPIVCVPIVCGIMLPSQGHSLTSSRLFALFKNLKKFFIMLALLLWAPFGISAEFSIQKPILGFGGNVEEVKAIRTLLTGPTLENDQNNALNAENWSDAELAFALNQTLSDTPKVTFYDLVKVARLAQSIKNTLDKRGMDSVTALMLLGQLDYFGLTQEDLAWVIEVMVRNPNAVNSLANINYGAITQAGQIGLKLNYFVKIIQAAQISEFHAGAAIASNMAMSTVTSGAKVLYKYEKTALSSQIQTYLDNAKRVDNAGNEIKGSLFINAAGYPEDSDGIYSLNSNGWIVGGTVTPALVKLDSPAFWTAVEFARVMRNSFGNIPALKTLRSLASTLLDYPPVKVELAVQGSNGSADPGNLTKGVSYTFSGNVVLGSQAKLRDVSWSLADDGWYGWNFSKYRIDAASGTTYSGQLVVDNFGAVSNLNRLELTYSYDFYNADNEFIGTRHKTSTLYLKAASADTGTTVSAPNNRAPVVRSGAIFNTVKRGGEMQLAIPYDDPDDIMVPTVKITKAPSHAKWYNGSRYAHDGSTSDGDSLSFVLIDSHGNQSAEATITILIVDAPTSAVPQVANLQTEVVRGKSIQINLPVTSSNGGLYTVSIDTQPTKGRLSLIQSPNVFAYFNNGIDAPSDSFTYKASSAAGTSGLATVNIGILPIPNNSPKPVMQGYRVVAGGAQRLQLKATDIDPEDAAGLIFAIVTPPQFGRLEGSGDQYTYTHTAAHTQPDSFTWRVTDKKGASATLTEIITIENKPPRIVKRNNMQAAVGQALSLPIQVFDDASGTALSMEVGSPGSIINGNWVHTFNTAGVYVVKFRAVDRYGLVSTESFTVIVGGACNFSDMSATDPNTAVVCDAVKHGIIVGYTENDQPVFKPNQGMTRAEFAKVLALGTQLPISTGGTAFSDVPDTHPMYQYVQTLKNNQLVRGYGDGSFRPDQAISRAEMALMLNRFAGWGNVGVSDVVYTDVPLAPPAGVGEADWLEIFFAVGQLRTRQILSNTETLFRPLDPLTRMEALLVLTRLNQFSIAERSIVVLAPSVTYSTLAEAEQAALAAKIAAYATYNRAVDARNLDICDGISSIYGSLRMDCRDNVFTSLGQCNEVQDIATAQRCSIAISGATETAWFNVTGVDDDSKYTRKTLLFGVIERAGDYSDYSKTSLFCELVFSPGADRDYCIGRANKNKSIIESFYFNGGKCELLTEFTPPDMIASCRSIYIFKLALEQRRQELCQRAGTFASSCQSRFDSTPALTLQRYPDDAVLDDYVIPAQINVPRSTAVESSGIMVKGANVAVPISIAGGEYRINNGAYTSASSSTWPGDIIYVRVLSSANFAATTSALLTIGNVARPFDVHTRRGPTTQDSGEWKLDKDEAIEGNLTVSGGILDLNGHELKVSGDVIQTGGLLKFNNGKMLVSGNYRLATGSAEAPQCGNGLFEMVNSGANYIDGDMLVVYGNMIYATNAIGRLDQPLPTNLVGGSIFLGGNFDQLDCNGVNPRNFYATGSHALGLIGASPNKQALRFASSGKGKSQLQNLFAWASVGGVEYASPILIKANQTNGKGFAAQAYAQAATLVISEPVNFVGDAGPTIVSVMDGEMSINGGAFTTQTTMILLPASIKVRTMAPMQPGAWKTVVLTVGDQDYPFAVGVSATGSPWVDMSPDDYFFAGATGATNSYVESAPIFISGLSSPVVVSVAGGEINIDGGAYSANAVLVSNGQQVKVRVLASALAGQQKTATVVIGDKSATFVVIAAQVALLSQTISFGAAPTIVVGGTVTVSATGGASGNAVTFSSTTLSVCTISGSTVTAITAGTCTIAADQAGNANYSAATQVSQSITVGTGNLSLPLLLEQGWNLLGNSLSQPISVATMLGDPATVTTVWKWDTATSGWQFYAPSMASEALQTYASGKGYAVLTVINPGEGYWVNARLKASLGTLSGAPFRLGASDLKQGWNLVATGNDVTPSAFNLSLTNSLASSQSAGTVPINLTTLWAWDNLLSKWYFYSPQLEGSGNLASYIAGKGYMDFAQFNAGLPQYNKKLGNGTGFWVNRP